VSVPTADVLDVLDGGEISVADVNVVGNSQEGFMDVGYGIKLDSVNFQVVVVYFSDLLVENIDI